MKQNIDEKIKALLLQFKDKNVPTKFSDFDDLQFKNYADFVGQIRSGTYYIYVNYICQNIGVFKLIATASEIIKYRLFQIIPYLTPFILIFLAIYLGNYWLLTGILSFFIAAFFSSTFVNPPLYPFKGIRVMQLSFIAGAILIILGSPEFSIIPFSYWLTHFGYHNQRETYRRTFVIRSIESESVFCLLYGSNNIRICPSQNLPSRHAEPGINKNDRNNSARYHSEQINNKDLIIPPSLKTPEIRFCSTGELWIKGRSIMEDAGVFYDPIVKWVKEYCTQPAKTTTFSIMMDYFNEGGFKYLQSILHHLTMLSQNSKVKINWYYEKNDEDMQELANTFNEITKIHINILPIEQQIKTL